MPSMPGGRSGGTGHVSADVTRPLYPPPFSVTDFTSGSIKLSRLCTSLTNLGGREKIKNSVTATPYKEQKENKKKQDITINYFTKKLKIKL